MKVVILAGGLGTRLSEETGIRPKPMVEIGGIPIICHIMKIYSYYGYNDFIICLGYKGEMIKDYFLNYHSISSDFTIDLKNDEEFYEDCSRTTRENYENSLYNEKNFIPYITRILEELYEKN